jgi:hypothetical protein
LFAQCSFGNNVVVTDRSHSVIIHTPHEVRLVGGEVTTMLLAERGVLLGGVTWVREFRRLTVTGHQTSIVTTIYRGEMAQLSAAMFARWCQENFFAYMQQHYGLDKLISYGTEKVPDITTVINPEYRCLDGEIRKKVAKLSRLAAEFGSLSLEGDIEPDKVNRYESQKGELQVAVEQIKDGAGSAQGKTQGHQTAHQVWGITRKRPL